MTIMIVEDNPSMRSAIRSVAAQKKDTVIECSNGEEAVSCFQAAHPDVILMDISMPVLDGIQAARAIHEMDRTARIIMVSENDSSAFRTAAAEFGAFGFVSKENLFELESILASL